MKMTWLAWLHILFGLFFYSSQRPRQISPTADFDCAAIPPPIFSMVLQKKILKKTYLMVNERADTFLIQYCAHCTYDLFHLYSR